VGLRGLQVTGHWRKLHTEKLHGLYCALDTVRLIKWSGHVACGVHLVEARCMQTFGRDY